MAVSRRLEDIHEGEVVTRVQKALERLGLNPGKIDGVFSCVTERAIIDFQTTHGMVANGIVETEDVGSARVQRPRAAP
jgi:peptidoglycan hydrolase-like protein with peptidoglycan-binding domain